MRYDLFLFDLDDTLLDFSASERLAFKQTVEHLKHADEDGLYTTYREISNELWEKLERHEINLDHLKMERFRRLGAAHGLTLDVPVISEAYLDQLMNTAVLIDHAAELCAWLSEYGEIGIVTNGFQKVQEQRIRNSPLAPYVSFICASDICGFTKPDARIFEHGSSMAKKFEKHSTLMIGDRLNADILGAHRFGIDSCWVNLTRQPRPADCTATYEIHHLSQLRDVLATSTQPHAREGAL